ncbi:glyoxalase superfamily protein [Variovorax sp. PBL-H6]|uniref:glyoxalase superfamily protein n=2 Tax=Variovorax TaxID=34072 RepID=UPI0013A593AC|nr:glyoxalase superfamily protein [Variovorax sp. PBL-H6]
MNLLFELLSPPWFSQAGVMRTTPVDVPGYGETMEFKSTHTHDSLYSLKAQAEALQVQANASGHPLKRADALEAVAKQNGFRDWNAAAAAGKAGRLVAGSDAAPWTTIDAPLPQLRLRVQRPGDQSHAAVVELMRWAKQLDYIGDHVSDDPGVGDLMAHIGGDIPYVFVRDPGRFEDDLFHLCDRGYDDIEGVVFTREQLEESGVVAWQKLRGSHDGDRMFSVVDDNLRMHSDRVELKQAARVVASIAMMADQLSDASRARP